MPKSRKERTAKATAARIKKQQETTEKRVKLVLETIESNPGINLTGLKKITPFQYSTIQHIVNKLDDENKIITKYTIGAKQKAVRTCWPKDYGFREEIHQIPIYSLKPEELRHSSKFDLQKKLKEE